MRGRKRRLAPNNAHSRVIAPRRLRGTLATACTTNRILQVPQHRPRSPGRLHGDGILDRELTENPAPCESEVRQRVEQFDAFDLRAAYLQRARQVGQPLTRTRSDLSRRQRLDGIHVGHSSGDTVCKPTAPSLLEPQVAPFEQRGRRAEFVRLETARVEPGFRHRSAQALPHLHHALGPWHGYAHQPKVVLEDIQQPHRA